MANFTLAIDGKDYSLDPESITVRESKEIRGYTGKGIAKLLSGIDPSDPSEELIEILVYLMRKRAGEEVSIDANQDVALIGLFSHVGAAADAQAQGDDDSLPLDRSTGEPESI
jgi:hypothetical protein